MSNEEKHKKFPLLPTSDGRSSYGFESDFISSKYNRLFQSFGKNQPVSFEEIKQIVNLLSNQSLSIEEALVNKQTSMVFTAYSEVDHQNYVTKLIDPVANALKNENFDSGLSLEEIIASPHFEQIEKSAENEFRICSILADSKLKHCVRYYKKWMWTVTVYQRNCYIITMEQLTIPLLEATRHFNNADVIYEISRQILPLLDKLDQQYHIYHRDISDSNIMCRSCSNPEKLSTYSFCLIDFGSASINGYTVSKTGTPPYMAPEKDVNSEVYRHLYEEELKRHPDNPTLLFNISTDLYSLGALFQTHFSDNITPPLSRILKKATNPFPKDRFQSGREMLNVIADYHKNYNPSEIKKRLRTQKNTNIHLKDQIKQLSQKNKSLSWNNLLLEKKILVMQYMHKSKYSISLTVFIPFIVLTILFTFVGTHFTYRFLSKQNSFQFPFNTAKNPDSIRIFLQDLEGFSNDSYEVLHQDGTIETYGPISLLQLGYDYKDIFKYIDNNTVYTCILYDNGYLYVLNESSQGTVFLSRENIKEAIPLPYGTVLLTNDHSAEVIGFSEYDFSILSTIPNLTSVCFNNGLLIGLDQDGNVYSVGDNQLGYSFAGWENIKKIISFENEIIGISTDGKVFATGNYHESILDWKGINDIVFMFGSEVALNKSGSLLVADESVLPRKTVKEINKLHSVDAISCSGHHIAAKIGDHVVCVGTNIFGECNTEDWDHIDSVKAYHQMTIGYDKFHNVKKIAGIYPHKQEIDAKLAKHLKNIYISPTNTVLLLSDGTTYATGGNAHRQLEEFELFDLPMNQMIIGNGFMMGVSTTNELFAAGNYICPELIADEIKNVKQISLDPEPVAGGTNDADQIPLGPEPVAGGANDADQIPLEKKVLTIATIDGTITPYLIETDSDSNISFFPDALSSYEQVKSQDTLPNKTVTINTMPNRDIEISGLFPDLSNGLSFVSQHFANESPDIEKHGSTHIIFTENIRQIISTDDAVFTLFNDGTVSVDGFGKNAYNDVKKWNAIIEIACGSHHVAGLRKDGKVLVASTNTSIQASVKQWESVKNIYACGNHTYGVLNDGSVVYHGTSSLDKVFSAWHNINHLVVSESYIIGYGNTSILTYPEYSAINDYDLSNIVQIVDSNDNHTYVLDRNGDVFELANHQQKIMIGIQQIATIDNSVIGLKKDGTLSFYGSDMAKKINPDQWKEIAKIKSSPLTFVAYSENSIILTYGYYAPSILDDLAIYIDLFIKKFRSSY